MGILASDNFNRANENPIASPWIDPGFSGAAQLLDNAFNGTNSDGGVYYDGGVTWPADQYSKFALKTPNISESDSAGGPTCRVQTGAASAYIVGVGGGNMSISKIVAGSFTTLASASLVGVPANSVVEIRAVGTTISGWLDGVQIVSVTDATFSSGKPGLYKYPSGTISYDDWEGGDFAGDTTAPNITSTGAGPTNGPFAVNVAENSTAVAVTLTSDEALSSVTKGGADGALFTLAGSGLTRTLAPTAAFDFESLPHANPFVVTLTFADTATPTPNERTVTVNFTVTNVSEPPLAPTIGTAVAGNAQATVNGTAPVNTGRPAITGYRSTATPGGSTVTGASLPIMHTGLTNGTAYTFTLAAQNADGFGPESAASNSVTPSAPAPGPTINTQPTNQTAKVGASATFTVAATSSGGALSYQWHLGGTPISGANSASYTRTGVALGDHGAAFTCAVTDSNGTTVSSAATLTVAVTFAGVVPDFTGTTGASSSIDLSSYFSGGLSRTFAVLSGSMPTGLTQVGSTAVWTGTLGSAGSGSVVVRATDSATNTDVTNTVNWVIGLTTPGTVTSSVLKNNDGWVFANVSGIRCFARNPTTGADVLLKTGLSSNGSGVVSFADAALAQNTDYELRWKIPDPEQPTHGANGWEIVRST